MPGTPGCQGATGTMPFYCSRSAIYPEDKIDAEVAMAVDMAMAAKTSTTGLGRLVVSVVPTDSHTRVIPVNVNRGMEARVRP